MARLGLTGKDVGTILLVVVGYLGSRHGQEQTEARTSGTLAWVSAMQEQNDSLASEIQHLRRRVQRLEARRRFIVAYSDTAFVGPPEAKRNRWWPFR